MKSFTQIAIPHEDIVQGRLNMDVFAADLWQVATGKAPADYQDPALFFAKTYPTRGLKNILDLASNRLKGKSGDSVIQLQTPFGGGKTHTLIALYHRAKEWMAKVVVIDGTAFDPKERKLWEELEKQLTGKVKITKGDTAPGKEKLTQLLTNNSPVLILMDEVLQYITKAAGVKVGDSNLAAQSFAFLQELTGAVATVGKAMLVLTLPSSLLEHYDENAERVFQQLQKITGRIEKIYTPVSDDEIECVVRARLFQKVKDNEAKKVVEEFINYAIEEGLLSGEEISEYRNKFLQSYPFKPEVIDVLYKRWGSIPTFQRTRGVLRLLALVIYSLCDKSLPFIRLGDFDLNYEGLKAELIKLIGQEWESIIAQDIASKEAEAKKADDALGVSYRPYNLGTVVATSIFMMSFSGRATEKGASVKEIKMSSVQPDFPSTLIDTVINSLKERLFYLSDDGLFFTNQPNLNKILVSREENIDQNQLFEAREEILKRHITSSPKFKIYIYAKFSRDIPDSPELKLIILNEEKPEREFLEKCGETPRVYRNVLIFLGAVEDQREAFNSYIRKYLALRNVDSDLSLRLTDGQRKEVKNKLKRYEEREYEELRKYYRKLFLPAKNNFKEEDLGPATFGESKLDSEIYEYLRAKGEILEKISPKAIIDKYLSNQDYVEVVKLYEAFLRTPGELRLISKEALKESIKEGVKTGLFGFGYLVDGKPEKAKIKEDIDLAFADDEIIINAKLISLPPPIPGATFGPSPVATVTVSPVSSPKPPRVEEKKTKNSIYLRLIVPVGQISTIARIANYLNDKFSECRVETIIQANGGEIEISEYEDKIKEALSQAGVTIEEEKIF